MRDRKRLFRGMGDRGEIGGDRRRSGRRSERSAERSGGEIGGEIGERSGEIGDGARIKNLYPRPKQTPRPESPPDTFTWLESALDRSLQGRHEHLAKQSPWANDRQNGRSGGWGGGQDRPPSGRSPSRLGQRQRLTVHGSRFTANVPRRHVPRRPKIHHTSPKNKSPDSSTTYRIPPPLLPQPQRIL